MLDYIYEWIENIAFYLVIVVAIMQMVPGEAYKKYIRFFAGMILIFMLAKPVYKLFGVTQFHQVEYQKELQKIEEATGYLEDKLREEDVLEDQDE